jgi:predicted transposase YbfD/YdcC
VTPLLEELAVTGLVVTLDALHTHADLAQEIVTAGGDYLMVVKGNQPTLQEDIALVFAEAELLAETITEATTTDAHGGRIETRRLRASTALGDYIDWPGHAQVLEMRRLVQQKKSGKERAEVVYGITSLGPERATAEQLMKLWREHWHIENKLHWVRDVTFDEDRSQVRAGHAPQVMAALRNTAIGLLRVLGWANMAGACRHYAAQPGSALAAVGICFRE